MERLPRRRADLDEDRLHRRRGHRGHIGRPAGLLLGVALDAAVKVPRARRPCLHRRRGGVHRLARAATEQPTRDLAEPLVDVVGEVGRDAEELELSERDVVDVVGRRRVANVLEQPCVVADQLRRRLAARIGRVIPRSAQAGGRRPEGIHRLELGPRLVVCDLKRL